MNCGIRFANHSFRERKEVRLSYPAAAGPILELILGGTKRGLLRLGWTGGKCFFKTGGVTKERRPKMRVLMNELLVRWIAVMLVVVMGLVSLVPRVEASFVPSDQSASSISRQEDMATIQRALEDKLVRERLKDLGYTEEEIQARFDRLSDAEVHSLASQLDSLMPAGGWEVAVVVILLVAILVVLILMWTGHKLAV